jgi:transposase
MPTMTTRDTATAQCPTLLLAMDLGNTTWKLGFRAGGPTQPARIRTTPARDLDALQREIDAAKRRFGLAVDAPVVSCFEAGRDGFWLHRALTARGVQNLVVDSCSIDRPARGRSAKSDRLDTTALLDKLGHHVDGDHHGWSVVHVPSVADEDRRHLHRELTTLTWERTRLVNRIKGLLALHGIVLARRGLPRHLPATLQAWDGSALPPEIEARIRREWRRLMFVRREVLALIQERRERLRRNESTDPTLPIVRRLFALRAIGEVSAWVYATEFFAWRQFRNRRQVGAAAGLCSTRRTSGDLAQEQGISKTGNRYLRALAIELAWSWLRRQPRSALSEWYQRRYASGGARMRRIGIVALARKLLIALWRYLETGQLPTGAEFKPDRPTPRCPAPA